MSEMQSKIAAFRNEDAIQDGALGVLSLGRARKLAKLEAGSFADALCLLMTRVGVERPEHYFWKVTKQAGAKQARRESEEARRRTSLAELAECRCRARGTDAHSICNAMARREEWGVLHSAMEQLAPADRELLSAVYWECRSQADIAAQLGVQRAKVWRRQKAIEQCLLVLIIRERARLN